MPIYILPDDHTEFPNPRGAEDGLVAIGGNLQPERLINAYQNGIFPWYNEDEPILWWSPDPRCVIRHEDLKISKSMKQVFKKGLFRVSFDTCFRDVIHACSEVRYENRQDTWINIEMLNAYTQLHELGYAHSVEVWNSDDELVGGLYGLSMGACYFGESMFYKESNASKYGFIALMQKLKEKKIGLIDCQIYNPHLGSLGASLIPRDEYLDSLAHFLQVKKAIGKWTAWKFEKLIE
ncbi:MAG: leucyl/phenylalanyl-tRNA--protein transferase [Chitinophagales bacterium]|nr:leucyl/phenylalanyl-tRNA--protein transferase [Chitinophagales bacterium]